MLSNLMLSNLKNYIIITPLIFNSILHAEAKGRTISFSFETIVLLILFSLIARF